MIFALVAALLTALALAALAVPLLRRRGRGPVRAEYDLAVYRDQRAELARDRARGLIDEREAAAARAEIERRMLRAGRRRDAERASGEGGRAAGGRRRAALLALGLCVPALSAGLYATLGAPGLPGRPFAESPAAGRAAAHDVADSVARLRARLEAAPADVDGWLLLGRAYVLLQRYGEAAAALRRAAALAADDPEIAALLGEALVWAADGTVTAEAVRVFEAVLAARPAHPAARFHLALAHAQAGRLRRAYDMWRALAAETPADAPWRADLAALIRQAAAALGEADDSLPGAGAAPRGPTAEEAAAAAAMAPEDRAAMIRAMVEGLARRLAEAPDDLAGWRRLARSWRVLGEAAKAARAELFVAVLEARDSAGAAAPDPLWLQGTAALARGDDAEARRHWRRLLSRLPPGTPSRTTLAATLDALSRW